MHQNIPETQVTQYRPNPIRARASACDDCKASATSRWNPAELKDDLGPGRITMEGLNGFEWSEQSMWGILNLSFQQNVHACTCTYIHTYLPTYLHTYIHTHMHACMYVRMYAALPAEAALSRSWAAFGLQRLKSSSESRASHFSQLSVEGGKGGKLSQGVRCFFGLVLSQLLPLSLHNL